MMPDWIREWIEKDRLVRNKFKISHKYTRSTKRIQLMKETRNEQDKLISFKYMVSSTKYGKYWVRYNEGLYECSCPFFKHRGICSHIFGVCQITNIWPEKEFLFPTKAEV
jgi:hypothetical protein